LRESQRKRLGTLGWVILIAVAGICGFAVSCNAQAALILRSVPVPSDAEVVIDGRNFVFTEFGFENEVMYYTDQPWPEVVDFYREEMGKRGWQLAQEKTIQFPDGVWICLDFTWYRVVTVGMRIDGYAASSEGKHNVDRRTIVDTVALAPDFSRAAPAFETAFERLSCDP